MREALSIAFYNDNCRKECKHPVPHIRCTSELVKLVRTSGVICLEHDLILHLPATNEHGLDWLACKPKAERRPAIVIRAFRFTRRKMENACTNAEKIVE